MEDIYFTDQNHSQLEDRIVELAENFPSVVSNSDLDRLYGKQFYEFIDG